MNLILNPGFDDTPDFVGWTMSATGVALESAGSARSLPNSAELSATYAQVTPFPPTFVTIEGQVSQEIDVIDDQVYVLSAWVRTALPWGPVVLTVKGQEVARVEDDTGGAWELLAGFWKADATGPAGVAVKALLGDGEGSGIWLVDDAEVAMARGGYIAYSALITALKQITTANGYYNQVGNRVYPKLVRPETGMKLPYVCVIPEPDQPVDEDRGTYLMARWRFRISAFVAGSESMAEATSSSKAVLQMYDDLLRAVKPWSAGGVLPLNSAAVADVTPAGKDIFAGIPDGYSYGETSLIVDLSVPLTDVNLGPAGV